MVREEGKLIGELWIHVKEDLRRSHVEAPA